MPFFPRLEPATCTANLTNKLSVLRGGSTLATVARCTDRFCKVLSEEGFDDSKDEFWKNEESISAEQLYLDVS